MANKPHKTFMPLLCRFSVNDTAQPAKFPGPSSADPSSPKLSCIGQMKKKSTVTNNKNHFLPCNLSASNRTGSAKSSVHSNRYKLFSGKNISSPAIETASTKTSKSKYGTNRSKSCNGRRTPVRSNKCYTTSRDNHDLVRVVVAKELDPPLPVVKCGSRDQEVNVNLWKRRGIELKTLQIQPIRLSLSQNSNNNNGGFSVPSSATI